MKMAKEAMKMKKEAMAKMKKESPMDMKTSYKMKEAMAKMKDKSPMELKKDDSSMKKYKSDAQRKAVHASKAEKGMTMKKEEAMKMKKEEAMKMKKEAPMKAAKPDYIDLDGDGNKTESMKKAAADKKSGAKMKKKEPMTMKKEAMKMKKPPLKQDKTKNKKRKLSVIDKIKAASAAASTSDGPFGNTNFLDRYKQEKKKIRKGTFTGDSFKTG